MRCHILCLIVAAVLAGSSGCGTSPLSPSQLEGARWQPDRNYPDHRESDIVYKSTDGTKLAGTLMLPMSTVPHTVILVHYGSNRWARARWEDVRGWVLNGVAVFTYDKRGVGQSGGECCYTDADKDYFLKLGGDVMAGAHALQQHPETRQGRVGVFGFSQGGWVIPVAAAGDPSDINFSIIGSGPAVTLGEEVLYSALTGDSVCQATNMPADEIEQLMTASGPSKFDPRRYLEGMTKPALWIYGGRDLSVPVDRSVRALSDIKVRFGLDFTIETVPNLNHNWIIDGAMCQETGNLWNNMLVIFPWLRAKGLIDELGR